MDSSRAAAPEGEAGSMYTGPGESSGHGGVSAGGHSNGGTSSAAASGSSQSPAASSSGGRANASSANGNKTVDFVSEDDVRRAIQKGEKIYINAKTIITPAARDIGEPAEIFAKG
jgi:hypothetical protein